MNKKLLLGLALIIACVCTSWADTNPRPFTIPAIHEWKGGEGTLTLTAQSRIIWADARLRPAAESLARDLLTLTGQQLSVAAGKKAGDGDILFIYKPQKQLGDEGYNIDIARSIRIEAAERGAMHAVQTLLQIQPHHSAATPNHKATTRNATFPKGKITDRPDYPMRGVMMDCGRKYIPLSYLRRLVRTMVYYKMNTLNVHLNDNGFPAYFHNSWDETYSAFRLESELFPGLTAEDGSYTKAEFRQFVLDAAAMGVEVIPEIDVPAHSLAFAHYRPSLGSKEFGMDHLDLSNPEVIPFVDSLFAEYIAGPEPVFAGPRVHIGTDEYSNSRQETVELFRNLTDHLIHTIEAHGKQAALWGALTHAKGTTPVKADDVLMYCWYNGFADPDSMHALGYQLLSIPDGLTYIVPAAGYYYDYLNISNLYKIWTPARIGNKQFAERDPQIRGGMFAVWNDIIGNGIAVADIHHRVMPALQVMAEKAWAADTVRTCEEWLRLATTLSEAPGINDLGRYPRGLVLQQATVAPASTRDIPNIGWPYRVSFDIETPASSASDGLAVGKPASSVLGGFAAETAAPEERGTALFRSDDAEFYLSDPVTGRLGFVRDGYLFSFRHALRPGVREHIAIEGDNSETRLYVNGRLVETLGSYTRLMPSNKPFRMVRTLRFPLQRTDATLRSSVTNLRVESLAPASADDADPIGDMLTRILPTGNDASKFEWNITGGTTQQFTISCDGKRVKVSGTDYIAVATGINWYLQQYAGIDISWNAPTATLPTTLPACDTETHTASVDWRYYLNFCTYSYSMAFWGWERWQQELDWMALHGINMPLAITGMECVWREVLMRDYGYTLDEVNTFVTGSAYYGWFFMNNMTAWGGPQPESWYAQQLTLGRQVFQRMKDFGMSPVIPGYVGMIPKDFMTQAEASTITSWQPSDIVNGGNWCAFVRPYFVNNTARLREFAANYYAAFNRLFGDVCQTHFYAIDPFHEGGVPDGVTNAEASITAMWEALQAYDTDAVWVAQHWQNNPTTILTHAIPRGRLIILDLHGDQYADTQCSGNHQTADGENHDWVWGQVSNFGGNVGLFGRMDRLIDSFYAARDAKTTNRLVGIGALPEGIENNAMLYDLLYALPWTSIDYTRQTWIEDYVRMRYGTTTLLPVWTRLANDIYQCPNDAQQGSTESVFLMRPSLTPRTVSSWASSSWYWNRADLRTALREMLAVSKTLADNANYRYDLVDITRQALADYGMEVLQEIGAENEGMKNEGMKYELFLQLILDQDRLLGTRPELRLGRWTTAARALGTTKAESDLYERNARMLLTTWGDRQQCENGGLHDYANREWNGLLASYYYPRWKAFFQNGYVAQNWFDDYEWPFATGATGDITTYLPDGAPYAYNTFSPNPVGNEIAIAKELYNKYFAHY